MLKSSKELYPQSSPYFGDYQPIIESFGKVILQVDDNDYQGDSRILYKDGDRIGYLLFGWGSCSGCDALQACNSHEQVDELIADLWDSITWFDSVSDALAYFRQHDWEGDWSWHTEEQVKFISSSIELLEKM